MRRSWRGAALLCGRTEIQRHVDNAWRRVGLDHMKRHDRQVCTFIVRLWFEPTESVGSPGEWRGEAEQVAPKTDEQRKSSFRTLEGLVGTLKDLMDRSHEKRRSRTG